MGNEESLINVIINHSVCNFSQDKMSIDTATYLDEKNRCDVIGLKMTDNRIGSDIDEYTMNSKG